MGPGDIAQAGSDSLSARDAAVSARPILGVSEVAGRARTRHLTGDTGSS